MSGDDRPGDEQIVAVREEGPAPMAFLSLGRGTGHRVDRPLSSAAGSAVMHVFLQTERLLLRRFTEADVDHLLELDSDPDVMRFVNGGRPTSREVIQYDFLPAFLRYYDRFAGYGFWAAIEKDSGEFLGWFHFRPPEGSPPEEAELGYRLRKCAWGKGYGTEGSRALIRKGFVELGVQRVVALSAGENLASRRVMEKVGMSWVRTFYQPWPDLIDDPEEAEQEIVEYALLRADWEQQEAATSSRPTQ